MPRQAGDQRCETDPDLRDRSVLVGGDIIARREIVVDWLNAPETRESLEQGGCGDVDWLLGLLEVETRKCR